MDWMLFWTAFGAIGGTVGALATAGAIIVALWQTKYAYKKKLRVTFSDVGAATTTSGVKLLEFVSVTVTNIGNRSVIIERWGFKLTNKQEVQIFSDMPISGIPAVISEALCDKFPKDLAPEQQTTFHYQKNLFNKIITEYCGEGTRRLIDQLYFL